MDKIKIWVIDDLTQNYDLVLNSFPKDYNEYCEFYHFDKGMTALNLIKKALEEGDNLLLPDIVFMDFYIEGDGWTGDKLVKLIVELYKKYGKTSIKPYIIAFSSISKRNEDMMLAGANESLNKLDYFGVCQDIINIFYDKDSILDFIKTKYTL